MAAASALKPVVYTVFLHTSLFDNQFRIDPKQMLLKFNVRLKVLIIIVCGYLMYSESSSSNSPFSLFGPKAKFASGHLLYNNCLFFFVIFLMYVAHGIINVSRNTCRLDIYIYIFFYFCQLDVNLLLTMHGLANHRPMFLHKFQ